MTLLQSKSRYQMIESGGRLCQMLGLPRSIGQIYGLLFLAPAPLSLDDMVTLLGISKASASSGTRHLISWGAIRQVWVPGQRRDFYEVVADFSVLLRSAFRDFLKPRLASTKQRLDDLVMSLEEERKQGLLSEADHKLCVERVGHLQQLHNKLHELAPLAENAL